MKIHSSRPVKWLLPLVFLILAGCGGNGAAVGTAAATVGKFALPPTWTASPSQEWTPTPSQTATFTITPTPSFAAAAVSAGRKHTCIVTDKGAGKCWGENEDGQLGDGTTALKKTAVDVLGLEDTITGISAGYNHSCALTSGREVACWGNNALYQLGDGTQTSRSTAVVVELWDLALDISAGYFHTCAAGSRTVYCWGIVGYKVLEGEEVVYIAYEPYEMDLRNLPAGEHIESVAAGSDFDCLLTDGGSVYCWGRNDKGQLGRGENSYSDEVPGRVGGLKGAVKKLSVGGSHACVIVQTGAVQCWGYNISGQLGKSSPVDSAVPLEVAGIQSASDISAGLNHTCALVSGGPVKCWGNNKYGQLGGTFPQPGGLVEAGGLPGSVRSISAGGSHTCALTQSGGLTCWGNNKYGQLGENIAPISPTPTRTETQESTPSTRTPGVTPPISGRVSVLAAGKSHTCAVTDAGDLRCWGKNEHGELGNGTWKDSGVPVEVSGLNRGVKAVAAGWGHTCALTDGGGVKCWGYNKNGELGDGSNTDSNTPVDVRGLESGVTALEAADDHTCALLSNGTVKCWGFNLYGQLGDGTAENRNSPVDVTGLTSGTAAVAAGWGHTCALSVSGGVKCWGNNHYGQVGNGSEKENYHEPVAVAGMANGVAAISADGGQTCALTSRGLVMCWGNNKYGQLGDGTAEVRRVPVAVVGLKFAPLSIAAGWNHTCALKETGDMVCWGWNYYGQLGNGMRTTSILPVDAGALMYGVSQAALGFGHSCVVTEFGGVQCWGLNEFGQLGDGTTVDAYLPVDVNGLQG